MTDTQTEPPPYPRSYKLQRRREKDAKAARERALSQGSTLPPICGYTYKPRRPKNTPPGWSGAPVACFIVAGDGTKHRGTGFCDFHEVQCIREGAKQSQSQQIKTARDLAYKNATFFGVPKPTDPHTALMDEISRTASVVAWLEAKLEELREAGQDDESILQTFSIKFGIQPSVWYQMYMEERQHLVRTAAAAIKAGVQERKVQIAESQGRIIVAMFMAFLHDKELGLSPEQLMRGPQIVRKHLLALPQAAEAHPAEQILDAEIVSRS